MKTIKIIFFSILAYILATAVILSSLHARDLIANSNIAVNIDAGHSVKVHTDDVSAKSIADLHNHVDKTALKSFVKSASDQTILIRQRQTQDSLADVGRPLSVIVMEMIFMFRLTYALALSR